MSNGVNNAVLESSFESLWDAVDVAKFLKVSRSWVYEKAEKGLLPVLYIGSLLRFSPEAIKRWALGEPAKVLPLSKGK